MNFFNITFVTPVRVLFFLQFNSILIYVICQVVVVFVVQILAVTDLMSIIIRCNQSFSLCSNKITTNKTYHFALNMLSLIRFYFHADLTIWKQWTHVYYLHLYHHCANAKISHNFDKLTIIIAQKVLYLYNNNKW